MKQQKPRVWMDEFGKPQPERRSGVDRRDRQPNVPKEVRERRNLFRRRVDRERFETDHKQMIDDALADFAEEHGGHL